MSRGLSTALVEARDIACGTSSRSSKLVHGGLRYLEQQEFGLVREALRERSLLLNTLAPHLVRPVPFLYPFTEHWERPYIGAGMLLYDGLAGHTGLPRHRHLTKRGALRLAPALKPDSLVGAVQYYDAQVDDARHTLATARTAAAYGAAVASQTQVVGFLREGERVAGVRVRDNLSDAEFDVRARQVVNATGVWTDDVQHLVGERGKFRVRASKGVHLVVPRDRVQLDTGLILRTEKSVLFVIPWGRHWIIGTTDTDWALDKAHPAASASDIEYVLEHVNKVLAHPLGHEDVEGVYAGLRPLLEEESESTSTLSREHTVAVPVAGLVSVAGGKYTTYRIMARDAIDAAARGLDEYVPPSVHRTRRRWSAPTATASSGTPAAGCPPRAACTSRGSSISCSATARASPSCCARSRSARSWATRSRAPTTTWPWRSGTRPPTRARCGSTTCSPAARASRSRRSTAVSPRPARRRG